MAKRETYELSLHIDKIPKRVVRKFSRRDGSAGAEVKLIMSRRNSPDLQGYQYSIFLQKTKEEREAGKPTEYVGNAKQLGMDTGNDNEPF